MNKILRAALVTTACACLLLTAAPVSAQGYDALPAEVKGGRDLPGGGPSVYKKTVETYAKEALKMDLEAENARLGLTILVPALSPYFCLLAGAQTCTATVTTTSGVDGLASMAWGGMFGRKQQVGAVGGVMGIFTFRLDDPYPTSEEDADALFDKVLTPDARYGQSFRRFFAGWYVRARERTPISQTNATGEVRLGALILITRNPHDHSKAQIVHLSGAGAGATVQ